MAQMKETEISFESMREKNDERERADIVKRRKNEKRERKTMTERVQYVLLKKKAIHSFNRVEKEKKREIQLFIPSNCIYEKVLNLEIFLCVVSK